MVGAVRFFWLLILCIITFPFAAPANDYACAPSPEVQKLLDRGETKSFVSLPYAAWILESGKLYEEAARKYPNDLFAQQKYHQWLKIHGDEAEYDSMVQKYKSSLADSPLDPIRLFLYGSILKGDDSFPYFQQALQKSSSFPLVLSVLASYYYRKSEHESVKHTIDMWISLCPQTAEPYEYMDYLPDVQYKTAKATKLRALLTNLELKVAITSYPTLWRLEFSLTTPEKYDQIRTRVREDLQRFPAVETLTMEQLRVLKEAYVLLEDPAAVRKIEDDLVRLFPDSEDAADVVMDRWTAEHPEDNSAESQAELLTITKEWMKRWPHNSRVNWKRLSAMYHLDDLPPKELKEAIDRVLQDARETPHMRYPPSEFFVAQIMVDHRLALERIPAIIDQGVMSALTRLRRTAHVYSSQQMSDVKQDVHWRADSLRASLSIAAHKTDQAQEILMKLKEDMMRTLEPEVMKTRKANYWALMAEQAMESRKDADALTYYQIALQNSPADFRIQKFARRLWNRLGGSDEGWNQFRMPPENIQITMFTDINMQLPEFDLPDMQGRIWKKSDLKGKVTFINVWATWCGPCLWELPAIEELYQKLKDKSGILLITLNIDDNPGIIPQFLSKHGYRFPVVPALPLVDKLDPEGRIPRNWIVNQDAVIVKEATGFIAEEKSKWTDQIVSAIIDLQKKTTANK